jgi:hypothetical protein
MPQVFRQVRAVRTAGHAVGAGTVTLLRETPMKLIAVDRLTAKQRAMLATMSQPGRPSAAVRADFARLKQAWQDIRLSNPTRKESVK